MSGWVDQQPVQHSMQTVVSYSSVHGWRRLSWEPHSRRHAAARPPCNTWPTCAALEAS